VPFYLQMTLFTYVTHNTYPSCETSNSNYLIQSRGLFLALLFVRNMSCPLSSRLVQ